jgi:transcriptional regulator with XRE-family HTH domain
MRFAERLEELMEKKGVTPYKVSKDTGIGQSTFTRWKQQEILPDGANLLKLSQYFNVSSDYLLGKTDDPSSVSASAGDVKIDILARAARNMTEEEKDKLIEMAKVLFRKAFDEK